MEQYDVFISYSRKDFEIADRIEKELKKYDISYFIDRTAIGLGEDFARRIAECIYNCNILLFVWSENSNQSINTANEISLAIEFEKTIVPFKIGKFKPDFNLAYNLVRFNRIDAVDLNDAQICSMASKLAAQLGKAKVSDAAKLKESSKSASDATKNTSTSDTFLKVYTDTECRVYIDNVEKGIAYPLKVLRIPLRAGSYCLLFESTADKNNSVEEIGYNIPAHTESLYQVKLKRNAVKKSTASSMVTDEPVKTTEEMFYEGCKFYKGEGVVQDYKQAVYWYQKAAENGDADAMYNLGVCYYNGRGVVQDYKQAVYWYKKAADEYGYTNAMYNLGNCYYSGEGVDQDYKKAVYWYQKSAEKGDAYAMYALSICYRSGRGVIISFLTAHKLYEANRVAKDGDTARAIEMVKDALK